ncbi:GGDEF domain-containing protein [Psychromonas sp. KJ10-10]|uniref:GGDEF domain-containing protein n=1 Tax=Psychromonas sp. KJ10-10 TaxID=3391823 RepID=UPI0039B40A93
MARVVVIRDITKQKQAQKEREDLIAKLEGANRQLQSLATTDALTGLFNRGYISHKYAKEIKKSQRYGSNLTIVMMDIDHFKKINDSYGHQFGDIVLQRVSQTIKSCTREMDRVGRYGGEEFLIILPNTKLENGYQLANRIRETIESINWEYKNMKVTISGGLAQYHGESEIELLKTADTLLYCAKSQGRNRIIK